MDYIRDLWQELCSYDNLFLAYKKARKHKTTLDYVLDFEKNLEHNLMLLRSELLLHSYKPKPLVHFIICDPKTRKISKSDFRDRVIHHALCNIIEPIFEKSFIFDSFANRIGKGTLKAVERFDFFKRKASKNNTLKCYVFKLLKKSNLRKMRSKLQNLKEEYYAKEAGYDDLYDVLEGWIAYAKNANTHKLRKKILADFEREFCAEIPTKEINRYFKTQKKG